jgi:hypothetical protein
VIMWRRCSLVSAFISGDLYPVPRVGAEDLREFLCVLVFKNHNK